MKYAIVTPSYEPDFERCRLLCESIRRFVSGDFHHYILIEKQDRPLFSSLISSNTSLIEINEFLPRWLKRVPGFRAGWLSFKTLPVRNWIIQQVVKLTAPLVLNEPALAYADSDTAFFRPFDLDWFEREGALRLYRVPHAARIPTHTPWHRAAAELLGLPVSDYFGATYIGHPTTWRRENVAKLHARIEETTSLPWAEALCRRWQFSEYILYGVFVEHILGIERAGHFSLADPICHNSWDYKLENDADLRTYFGRVKPHHVAVMVSSKQYMPVSRYRHLYEAIVDGSIPTERELLVDSLSVTYGNQARSDSDPVSSRA